MSKVIVSDDIGPFHIQITEESNKTYNVIYSCNQKELRACEYREKVDAIDAYRIIKDCILNVRSCLDDFSANTHKELAQFIVD